MRHSVGNGRSQANVLREGQRERHLHPAPDRSRRVHDLAGKSPGACDTKGKHGFNKNATCVAACFTDTFLTTFFSAGAEFSCFKNSADGKFNFNYTAKAKQQNHPKLKYRHWQNKGKGAGSMLKEEFIGDIANT